MSRLWKYGVHFIRATLPLLRAANSQSQRRIRQFISSTVLPKNSSTRLRRTALFGAATIAGLTAVAYLNKDKFVGWMTPQQHQSNPSRKPLDTETLPIIEAQFVKPPHCPPPITRKYPARVKVDLTVLVEEKKLDPAADLGFSYWTYNGVMPGPFIRARVGDILEVTLTNKDPSGMLHNLDFHAVMAPGGGATLLTVEKDETKTATFRLLYPGLYMTVAQSSYYKERRQLPFACPKSHGHIYHCSVDPIAIHITYGMYGLILVEPEEGLPPVDKEFYVVQGELYTTPPEQTLRGEVLDVDFESGLNENPSFVVFNGSVGSLTNENAMKVKTSDRVRIFFGNSGNAKLSSFHVIGTIFDKVFREGGLLNPPDRGIQTTLVPCGGATIVEFEVPVAGTYALVDHAIWRTEKGCVAHLDAEGPERPDLVFSVHKPVVCQNCKTHK